MPMLADLVDAVVGVDTHRDTHQVEIALPNGAPIAVTTISNDTTGYAQPLARIVEHAPGPRVVVSIEGTRSYGVGLARAAAAAGLVVLECEQPHRKARRGKGKSDPIDAHLAVLSALCLDAERLPTPRADGDREALRILLGARHDLTVTSTAQTNRLRALLRDAHDDTDRQLARTPLTDAALARLARRRLPRDASREHAIRHTEIRRLALAIHDARRALKDNRARSPSSTTSHPASPNAPASDPSPPPKPSWRSPTPAAAATTPRSPPSPAPARYRPAADTPCATASTAAATAPSTAPSTPSPPSECATAPPPRHTSPDAPPKARPSARSNAASSDTSPASSTAPSPPPWPHPPPTTRWPLDTSRSVNHYEAAA